VEDVLIEQESRSRSVRRSRLVTPPIWPSVIPVCGSRRRVNKGKREEGIRRTPTTELGGGGGGGGGKRRRRRKRRREKEDVIVERSFLSMLLLMCGCKVGGMDQPSSSS